MGFTSIYAKKTKTGIRQGVMASGAEYVAPVLVLPGATVASYDTVAVILSIVIDLDDCTVQEAYQRCMDIDRMPTRIVFTPSGAHVWYDLSDPIACTRRGGGWTAGTMGLIEWARGIQANLTQALGGDMASCSLVALRRNPATNRIAFESDYRWELAKLELPCRQVCRLESQVGDLRAMMRDAAKLDPASLVARYANTPVGLRNGVCWRLATCLLILTKGDPEKAGKWLNAWAQTCGYSSAEVSACLCWAIRSRTVREAERRGWVIGGKRMSTRSRSAQAAYASACASIAAEARIRKTIAAMEADGKKITIKGVSSLSGARREVVRRVVSALSR